MPNVEEASSLFLPASCPRSKSIQGCGDDGAFALFTVFARGMVEHRTRLEAPSTLGCTAGLSWERQSPDWLFVSCFAASAAFADVGQLPPAVSAWQSAGDDRRGRLSHTFGTSVPLGRVAFLGGGRRNSEAPEQFCITRSVRSLPAVWRATPFTPPVPSPAPQTVPPASRARPRCL